MPARTVGTVGASMRKGDVWTRTHLHRRSLRASDGQKNTRHRNKLFELGLWFDYPLCCIRAFTGRHRVRRQDRTPEQERCIAAMKRAKTFAYIPCNDCACKYLRENRSHAMTLRGTGCIHHVAN